MIDRLDDLNASIDMEKLMNENLEEDGGSMTAGRGQEPLFYVNVEIEDSKPIEEIHIVDEPIDDFILPPRGTSEVWQYDLLTHVELEDEPEEEDGDDDGAEKEQVHVQKFKKTVPKIHEFWITLVPDKK